jgi:hypothetical protein
MAEPMRSIDPQRELQIKLHAGEALIEQLREVAGGDEDFLADMVEGQTDVFDIMDKIVEAQLGDEIMVSGLAEHIKKLQVRKAAAEKRIEMAKALVAATLDHLGLKSRRFTLATYSLSPKVRTAIVTEESLIPSKFWKAQDPVIDKKPLNEAVVGRAKAIEAALEIDDADEKAAALAKANEEFPEIPGVTISNGEIQITVRRS